MKRILIFLLSLISYNLTIGQGTPYGTPGTSFQSSTNVTTIFKGAVQTYIGLINTPYTDTVTANNAPQLIKNIPGFQFMDAASNLWMRSFDHSYWFKINGGSGGSVNIYNTNGTLTADRTITGNGHFINFIVPQFNITTTLNDNGFLVDGDSTEFAVNRNAGISAITRRTRNIDLIHGSQGGAIDFQSFANDTTMVDIKDRWGYLNFGAADTDNGFVGYGFHDSAGVMQYKDSNNHWISFRNILGGGWLVNGNTVTAGSNFLGSTNNVSLRMRTNNVERMVIDSTGKVGIATNAPSVRFHLLGLDGVDAMRYQGIVRTIDSTTYKPVVADATGLFRRADYWLGKSATAAGINANALVDPTSSVPLVVTGDRFGNDSVSSPAGHDLNIYARGNSTYSADNNIEINAQGDNSIEGNSVAIISTTTTNIQGTDISILNSGNLLISTLPSSHSTDDSVVVWNTATQNVGIRALSDIGGGATIITLTKSQADDSISANALKPGQNYLITGVDAELYGGTDIILKAANSNTFEQTGSGFFWNPTYSGEPIWSDGDSYSINDKVAWGGLVWQNYTGNTGSDSSIFVLNYEDWIAVPFTTNDYNYVSDQIKYDYANDWITYRRDKSNNTFSCAKISPYSTGYNLIKSFQWGRLMGAYSNNYCEGSRVETINSAVTSTFSSNTFISGFMYNTQITGTTEFSGNTFISNSGAHDNIIDNSSVVKNILTGSSQMYSDTIVNGANVNGNTFQSTSDIRFNSIDNSSVTVNIIQGGADIQYNILIGSSNIASNTINAGSIEVNNLSSSSVISKNTLNAGTRISQNELVSNTYQNLTLCQKSISFNNGVNILSTLYSKDTLINEGNLYNSGSVGIGTTTPAQSLDVVGSIQQSAVISSMIKSDGSGKIVAATSGIDYANPSNTPTQVAFGNLSAQSAPANVITYTTGAADSSFTVSGRVTITALSVNVVTMTVTYTDETSTSRTLTFFPMGATSATLSVGASNFAVMGEIRVKASTTITVAVTATGVGSETYNASATITKLHN